MILTLHARSVLSNNPKGTSEHFATLDVSKRTKQAFYDAWTDLGEPFNYFAHKRNDIYGCSIVGVAKEVHEYVHDIGCDFAEIDGTRVNGLNEELSVFDVLRMEAQLGRNQSD